MTTDREGGFFTPPVKTESEKPPKDLDEIADNLEFLEYREVSPEEFIAVVGKFNFDGRVGGSPAHFATAPEHEWSDIKEKDRKTLKVFGPIECVFKGQPVIFLSIIADFSNSYRHRMYKEHHVFDPESQKEILSLSYNQNQDLKYRGLGFGSPNAKYPMPAIIDTKLQKSPDFARKFSGLGMHLFTKLLDGFDQRAAKGEEFIDMVARAHEGTRTGRNWLGYDKWHKMFLPVLEGHGYKMERHGDIDDFGDSDVYYVKDYREEK